MSTREIRADEVVAGILLVDPAKDQRSMVANVRRSGDICRWWTPLWGEMARVRTEMVTVGR